MGAMKRLFTDIQISLEGQKWGDILKTLDTLEEQYRAQTLLDVITTLANWQIDQEPTPETATKIDGEIITYTLEETYIYSVEARNPEEARDTFQAYMEDNNPFANVEFLENRQMLFTPQGEEV